MTHPRDITSHIKPRPHGRVLLTSGAEQALREAVAAEHAIISDGDLFQTLGVSLFDFLGSDFMRRSAWFKSQPAHTFTGLVFNDPDTREARSDVRLVVHDISGDSRAICAPAEVELPDNYFETRVIEETRVLYHQLLQ